MGGLNPDCIHDFKKCFCMTMPTLNLFHKTDCNITNKNGHKNDNDNDTSKNFSK